MIQGGAREIVEMAHQEKKKVKKREEKSNPSAEKVM